MPLTPSEERRYQQLGTELGFLGGAGAPEEDYGTLGFAGRTAANILPGALEKIVQPAQALLGEDKLSSIPDFFNVRAPRGVAEHVIGGAGELAEYLPAMIGTEGVAAGGLARLGMSAPAARIAGAGLGFGLPMAPQGVETAGIQGGVGALQSAAQHMGWRGKVAAGLLGGAAGYYEGAKGPGGSPEQGMVFGALNALGPTVIDPLVNKLTGYKPGAQPGGQPIPGQPAPSGAPYGPAPRPDIVQTGRAGLPFGMDEEAAIAQQQSGRGGLPYDIFAGLQDKTNSTGLRLNRNWQPPQPNGLPFWKVPDPMGLRLAGANGEGVVIQAADPAHVEAPTAPGGRRVRRTDYPPGWTPRGAEGPQPTADLAHRPPDLFPMETPEISDVFGQATSEFQYGRGTDPYNIFGERGVQPQPIMSQGETFPGGGLFPQAPLTQREQVILSQSRRGQQGTRAAENVGTDHLTPHERALKEGNRWINPDQSTPWVQGVSPMEGAGISDVMGQATGEFQYGRGTSPYDIFAGVQKPPIMTQGETFPVPNGGLFPQAPLSPREQVVLAAHRAGREIPPHPLPSESAPPPAPKPAAPKAEAPVPKKVPVKDIRPSIDIAGKRVFGKYGETHQDILNRWKVGKSEDEVALALMDFDRKPIKDAAGNVIDPGNPNYFIDKGGNRIPRGLLQEWHGFSDSQKLREAQGWKPPKTKPVEPAPAAAGNVAATTQAQIKAAGLTWEKTQDRIHPRIEIFAPEGKQFVGGATSLVADSWEDAAVRVASTQLEEFAALQKSATPPVDARPRVRVPGRRPGEWTEAVVIGKEGDVLHVEISDPTDPIFGNRTTTVLESEARPVAALQKPLEGGGVPFKDVESIPLTQEERMRELSGEQALGSVIESSGPARTRKTLPGREKFVLEIQEALDKLPPEPRALLGEILHQVNVAVKRDMPIHFERDMQGAKGAAYVQSGRIGVNLNWLHGIVQNWDTMSPASQTDALMKATGLFGHEVTHVVHRFAEKSGLTINGVPVTKAIVASVDGMSPSARRYVAEQIVKAKGEKNASDRVLKYLSGDLDVITEWYGKRRPGGITVEQAKELAAGEVMAEIGSIELVKRMKVDALPQGFREAVDKFKQVLINTVKWFIGKSQSSDIAALQNLESIASKMYDHFGAADEHGLAKAFPTSKAWQAPPKVNPFSSGAPVPPGAPGSTITVPPDVEVLNGALMRNEMLRLGVRGAVGATIGAYAGPALAPNQVSTAEGILLGGVAGIFGPALAKKLLSGDLAVEAAAALKAHPRNPLKALGHIMGGGKSLQELGIEARHGWTGIGSSMAKWVRELEKNFDLNLDPMQKALSEEARGAGAEQIAIVNDALDKVRWYRPNPTMIEAVGHYFEGRISKDDFQKLLTSPEQQQYGNFIVTAREAMTNLSKMFADGLPKSAFKTHVMETSETYLGKFYTAFTDGKFNMAHFDKAKQDMMTKLGYSDETANALMLEYMREVHANRKQFSTGRRGESGEKYDTSTLMRRMATTEEIEGQQLVVAGLEHDKHGADYIRERKKLDWMLDHKITDNWRRWLGEIEDPMQRMIYTIQKIHASAISGKTFDLLDTMTHTNGNKFSYTPKDMVQARALLESEIKISTPDKIAGLQERLRDLNGYGPIPQGAAYGKLSGKWVDRFTRDSLNTYDSPYQWMEQPIIRSLAEFNNLIKVGHTAYNPLTVLRNYLQAPLMGLISRTNWGDAGAAFKEIHYTKGEDYRLMLRKHIIGGDFTSTELSKGPGTIFSGYLDSDMAVRAGKDVHRMVLKGYQQPDMLTRAATFISARKRIAGEAMESGITLVDEFGNKSVQRFAGLQDAMNHPKIIDDAVAFTNRYTMNYSTVPSIVKAGRQLPFINLYISYTSEITRILKNLTEDIIAPGPNSVGRMHAITTLAAMAAIPTIMTLGGRSMLSDRDRKDWDQVEALSPHYNRSRFRIPYKREADGRFRYFDITNLLPADNYSQMMKAAVTGDTEAFWKANPLVSLQNTPLLNMATEQITGKDLRTDQTIEGYGRVRELLKEVLPPVVLPGYEGQRLQRAFSTNVEGTLGLTNLKSGVQYRPSDIVANYLTGMRFGNVMLSTMQRGAISEAKQQIAEQQQLMRETTNMNAGPEARMRSQEIYNKAVEQIMLSLHSKMPVSQP